MAKATVQVPSTPTEAASAHSEASAPAVQVLPAVPTETVPAKAKVTWLGDPADESEESVFMDVTFPRGKAVEVDNARLIAKAKANRFFKVS